MESRTKEPCLIFDPWSPATSLGTQLCTAQFSGNSNRLSGLGSVLPFKANANYPYYPQDPTTGCTAAILTTV